MQKTKIESPDAPAPGGKYSQAVRVGDTVFLSGQLPLDPRTGRLVEGTIQDAYRRCFTNMQAVCRAAGGELDDIVKLTIYFVDYAHAAAADEVMPEFFTQPYPARTRLTVRYLSKDAPIEIDAIMVQPLHSH